MTQRHSELTHVQQKERLLKEERPHNILRSGMLDTLKCMNAHKLIPASQCTAVLPHALKTGVTHEF